jgi:HSP20 family protein
MTDKTALAPVQQARDPFAHFRQMASELDRMFDDWPPFRWPSVRGSAARAAATWAPRIEVLEKGNRLVTRVELPGMKKEDVSVEVTNGQLTVAGERKQETEETKGNVYRTEREYGSFYRAVPLPDGVTLDDVKATFADGVLEVSVPLPDRAAAPVKKVKIEDPVKAAKSVV